MAECVETGENSIESGLNLVIKVGSTLNQSFKNLQHNKKRKKRINQ